MVVSRLLSRFLKNYIYGFHSHLIKKKMLQDKKTSVGEEEKTFDADEWL
jgi:hypothetical protein